MLKVKTAKYLITWQLVPAPFTPAGQAPIVSSLKGSGAVSYSAFSSFLFVSI
jgi:hypothetical protein